MSKIVVIGGGWAGCAAAVSAKKAGAEEVILCERTDMLLGTGLVGGIMRNNGRFTATEEAIALGGGDLFQAADEMARHRNINFPGHLHATLYDVARMEPAVRKVLGSYGVKVQLKTRIHDLVMEGSRIVSVISEKGESFTADAFIETTGTAGPQGNCMKYGNGCAMCILRCPTFGPRVSIAAKAGITEIIGRKADGSFGAMSGSCKLHKDSLSEELVQELNAKGVAVVPVPAHLRKGEKLSIKACQQYALAEFAENIVLLDTGHAKLMSPFYPLDELRSIPGLANARYEDPYAGGQGNSIRYLALSPRDNALKVEGVSNLFCGGEKAGLLVGHTEAIITGTLAGHNAARLAAGVNSLVLPDTLAVGDAIAHVRAEMQTAEGLAYKYTFSGAKYFERMKAKGLYTTNVEDIKKRVSETGLAGVFAKKVI